MVGRDAMHRQVVLVLGLLEELSAIMREADALGLISRDLRFLHMDVYPEVPP